MRWMAMWQEQEDGCEKFQHNSVSKRLVKKNEGRGSFYTSRGKRRGLGSMPSVG
jgi:hypothetical protein